MRRHDRFTHACSALAALALACFGPVPARSAELLISEMVGGAEIIRLDGLNSREAHVLARRTAGNARAYCQRYLGYLVRKGAKLEECVQQDLTLTAATPYEASADCAAGLIAASNGFVFRKRDDPRIPGRLGAGLDAAPRLLEAVGAFGTSVTRDSYRVALSQFRLLCPKFAN